MGGPKLLLPWGKTSILGHLLSQWQNLDAGQIAVVCSGRDQVIQSELLRLQFPASGVVENPEPERGMFSSIQCAASWGHWQPSLTHYVIVLGDQPHLRRSTLQTLRDFSAAHPTEVCQPSLDGRPRHPVFLPKSLFTQLGQWSGPDLKSFLKDLPLATCEMDEPGLSLDLDYPEDYARALSLWRQDSGVT